VERWGADSPTHFEDHWQFVDILPSVLKEGDCYHHGYAQISVGSCCCPPRSGFAWQAIRAGGRPWVYSTNLAFEAQELGFSFSREICRHKASFARCLGKFAATAEVPCPTTEF
jgi:hypothetical protein